jgi:predicted O-methyltransferase YrrM
METQIFENVDQYIRELVGEEDEALKAADRSVKDFNIPPISVSANQGKFLQILAKTCNAKKILEIGTLVGYSTIWMARALPKNGKLISLEFEPLHARVAKENIARAGLSNIVDVRIGRALDMLPRIAENQEGPFDMIFIDADKPPYTEYFQWALKLSRPGTLIVADNVIRDGKVMDPATKDEMVQGARRFNAFLASSKEVTATIIQTVGSKMHDGMALAVVN